MGPLNIVRPAGRKYLAPELPAKLPILTNLFAEVKQNIFLWNIRTNHLWIFRDK